MTCGRFFLDSDIPALLHVCIFVYQAFFGTFKLLRFEISDFSTCVQAPPAHIKQNRPLLIKISRGLPVKNHYLTPAVPLSLSVRTGNFAHYPCGIARLFRFSMLLIFLLNMQKEYRFPELPVRLLKN
jgi:hypothetical protein